LQIQGSNEEKWTQLQNLFNNNEFATAGLTELKWILDNMPANTPIDLDPSLARGLNYYTGTIIEVKAPDSVKMGSIGGGGRYDDLTGLFGVKGIPGVGISFGIDRIYDVMEELNLFPTNIHQSATLMFLNMGEQESKFAYSILNQCRQKGVSGEMYPEHAKLDKQLKYADKKGIPFAVIIGSKEMEEGTVLIKNLTQGSQETKRLSEFLTDLV
jgi:histidyl-tRNA synthetase